MVKNSGKQGREVERQPNEASKQDHDVDELFRLPLAEFTAARNTLAARLKQSGRGDEAALVKALVKPSISAWAVNQLYWNHREAFDRLIESGERFHKAQTSRGAGKVTEMRAALDSRRETLAHLSDLAISVLRDAGHNPAQDTVRRITTTLEAMSAYASRSDAPRPGRLTHDVDPPGFESFGSFVPGAATEARTTPPPKSSSVAATTRRKEPAAVNSRQLGDPRKERIAAAKVTVQDAKKSLAEARSKALSLEAAQKKAFADAKEAEKQKYEAEHRLEKARAASEEATRRSRIAKTEAEEASKEVKYAERTVEKATKELETLFRGSSAK